MHNRKKNRQGKIDLPEKKKISKYIQDICMDKTIEKERGREEELESNTKIKTFHNPDRFY